MIFKKQLLLRSTMLVLAGVLLFGCNANTKEVSEPENKTTDSQQTKQNNSDLIFDIGEAVSKEKFVGDVYMNLLVPEDSVYTTKCGSVTFKAGGRTNWHYHPSGQILIVTSGVGYHQIEGQEKEIIKKGDVIKVPKNVKHWHGASVAEDMTHLFMIPNTEMGGSKWFDAVSKETFED